MTDLQLAQILYALKLVYSEEQAKCIFTELVKKLIA